METTVVTFSDGSLAVLTELVNSAVQQQTDVLVQHLVNIQAGMKFLMIVAAGFFFWQVIKILYGLFGKVFFGGV
ncbi:MAG: hypothetical protein H0Z24_10210 [Thermosipho sp. (in: Bacteria)]|nr:hypothetical protein [Thermosipho sp. (in: thermotogales)]